MMDENQEDSGIEALKNQFGDVYKKAALKFQDSSLKFWDQLTADEKSKAFYAVCLKLYQGILQSNLTYEETISEKLKLSKQDSIAGLNSGLTVMFDLLRDAKLNTEARDI